MKPGTWRFKVYNYYVPIITVGVCACTHSLYWILFCIGVLLVTISHNVEGFMWMVEELHREHDADDETATRRPGQI